jgi:hypothetical protein
MPMLAVILGTFALWTVYWFVRMGGINHLQAKRRAREEAERADAARSMARNAPLRAVEDPRDAAICLMVLIARENGDPTREHVAEIERIARAAFGVDRDMTEHTLRRAASSVGFALLSPRSLPTSSTSA